MNTAVVIIIVLILLVVFYTLGSFVIGQFVPGKVGTMFRPLSPIHRLFIDKKAKVSNFSGAGTTPDLQSYSYMMKTNPISGGNRPKPYDMEFSDRLEY